ncbi:MAG: response regulator [Pseudomonas sp.]|nr:MAG: response regulator [Pseudomonas sp.]
MTTSLIYLVDDATDYRFLVQHLFKHHLPAYLLSAFADGNSFLKALAQLSPLELPSLILLDRHMPHLDGHQILRRLKEQPSYKKIPVVMMSADASGEEINGCYETGVNSFLRKSMDFESMKNQMTIVCQYWLEVNLKPVDMV